MSLTSLGWTFAGLACIALAVTIWRWHVRPGLKAALVVAASAGVSLAASGTFWSLPLLALSFILVVATWHLNRTHTFNRRVNTSWMVVLVLVFVLTKLPFVPALNPITWIGISYLFLRLTHVSLDARQGRLGEVTLPQMIIYSLHPATLIAGPVDRIQHSVVEQFHLPEVPSRYWNEGFWRIFTGLVKKLILANAFYAITAAYDAIEGRPPVLGAWIWVFAYSFYIYLDFSAYSDLAIGVGLLLGMRLPENFANPYLQPSITQFWQAWHITLSTWLRDYIFFPTSRFLLRRFGSRFSPVIVLISHLVTMVSSGLWHGFRLELVAWGAWHGIGLWLHNRWTILGRRYKLPGIPTPISIGINYLFVSLGWVFFAMRFTHALGIFARLFGLR